MKAGEGCRHNVCMFCTGYAQFPGEDSCLNGLYYIPYYIPTLVQISHLNGGFFKPAVVLYCGFVTCVLPLICSYHHTAAMCKKTVLHLSWASQRAEVPNCAIATANAIYMWKKELRKCGKAVFSPPPCLKVFLLRCVLDLVSMA